MIYRRDAECGEFKCFFLLSAGPEERGSAFHRAEDGGKQKDNSPSGLVAPCNIFSTIQNICLFTMSQKQ
jgi:hypothetical protein